MDIHKNARLSFRSREALVQHVVERALTLKAAAAAFSVTVKTATKWVQRYRDQGQAGYMIGLRAPIAARAGSPTQ